MTARNYRTSNDEFKTIRIKYHSDEIDKIAATTKGDWIDLRAAKRYHLMKGDFALIDLGVSMKLPDGYEAIVAPRSSTFKKWGVIMTNSTGIIDNSFAGDGDVWMMPVYATRETTIEVNDRICQFRIQRNQPVILFDEVEHLGNENRGGFGSTGVQ